MGSQLRKKSGCDFGPTTLRLAQARSNCYRLLVNIAICLNTKTVTNALRNHPLLEVVGANPLLQSMYVPNDPYIGLQEHLGPTKVNAYSGWDYGRGLGAVSLVAILDSGIDMRGVDLIPHPDFVAKYRAENWVSFLGGDPRDADGSHGTHVAGLATASTDNLVGIAATGFDTWPMSVKIYNGGGVDAPLADMATIVSGVKWATDHGASVLNMSFACSRAAPECSPTNQIIQVFHEAVADAYARGISVVAAAGNGGLNEPMYPAAFGQLHADDMWWPYNERLVLTVPGTIANIRHPHSVYGTWVDFAAPYSEDSGVGLLSTVETSAIPSGYDRRVGTSMAAPQVAGLAALLTSLGYTNTEVWDFIRSGATDLHTPGYDEETGWGRIDMGRSMQLAQRPAGNPGMVVVPNRGHQGVQWFNFQGSGFTPSSPGNLHYVDICWAPPSGTPNSCTPRQTDAYGVVGLGVQTLGSDVTGAWTVYMREQGTGYTTPTRTFIVEP